MPRPKGKKKKVEDLPAEEVKAPEQKEIQQKRQVHKFTTLTPDKFPLNRDIAGDAEKQYKVEMTKLRIRPLKVTRTINYTPNEKGMYITEYIVEY